MHIYITYVHVQHNYSLLQMQVYMYYTVPLVGIFDLCQGLRLRLHWWDQQPAYYDDVQQEDK